MSRSLQIYGCVIVNGREYADDQIPKLVGTDVSGWKFGGDQLDEESCFLITDGNNEIVFDTLPGALTFLEFGDHRP